HPQREQAVGLDESSARLVLRADVEEDAFHGGHGAVLTEQGVDRPLHDELSLDAQARFVGSRAFPAASALQGLLEGGAAFAVDEAHEVLSPERLVEGHLEELLRAPIQIEQLARLGIDAV